MIIITGPTASGKTALAVAVARELKGEIISADSRQVYRGMDIGTGKDLTEYEEIPYHLIDICEAGEQYNVFRFQRDFDRVYQELETRGMEKVLCGGTGLYVDAALSEKHFLEVPFNVELRAQYSSLKDVVEDLKTYKSLHNITDTEDINRALRSLEIEVFKSQNLEQPRKVPFNLIFGVYFEREELKQRITNRLKARLESGMVEEVKSLLNQGVKPDDLIYYGLEYKYLTNFILGRYTKEEMFENLNISIHQFAKRQMTWFRRMEKQGTEIYWIDGNLSISQKCKIICEKSLSKTINT